MLPFPAFRCAAIDLKEPLMRQKITVIGGGFVGEHVAMGCAMKELGDVVLLDILEGPPQGKALDLFEASPVAGFDAMVRGTNTYDDTADSAIVVITAGVARKPGMSRDDLLTINTGIVKQCAEKVKAVSPKAIVILVSNPLDVMAYVAKVVTGFPKQRVIGMAGVLDTARYRAFIAMELSVSVESITALVLGGHGDSMVPLPRLTMVGGVPLTELLPADRIDAIVKRTAAGGAEIVSLLKTGSAYYAPAASTVEMVESILKDKKKILPCAAYLEGEYGISGCFVGVPVKLGSGGIEQVYEVALQPAESAALAASASAVKEQQGKLSL
jgi:malate dehydrogenase